MASSNTVAAVAPFLDPHLVLVLLDSLLDKDVFAKQDLLSAKLSVLEKTKLVSAEQEIVKSLSKEPSTDLTAKQNKITEDLKTLQEESKEILGWINANTEEIEKLKKEKKYSANTLKEVHMVDVSNLSSLFKFAKVQYDSGDYTNAAINLDHFISLSLDSDGESDKQYFTAVWGKLSANILNKEWSSASSTIGELKELIESGVHGTSVEQVQQRAWLLHWMLFVLFNSSGEEFTTLADCFLQVNYINAMETLSPHLLRYLLVIAVLDQGKRTKSDMEELTRMVEESSSSDPTISFFKSIFVDFKFQNAKEKLQDCKEVLAGDFFLAGVTEQFIEQGNILILKTYCCIHKRVDVASLANKLGVNDQELVKKWLAQAGLEVDVKSENESIPKRFPSIFEQLAAKTNALRTQTDKLTASLSSDSN